MKSPNFENCQIGLSKDGKIEKVSNAFASWVGKATGDLKGENFRPFFLSLEKSWGLILPRDFFRKDFECFFPLSPESHRSSIGIHFQNVCYESNSVISLSPALAPHDSLKKAFMGDLMDDPRALANVETLRGVVRALPRYLLLVVQLQTRFSPQDSTAIGRAHLSGCSGSQRV